MSGRLVRSPVAACAALVIATLGWILGEAAWNRSEGPWSQLEVTERELALPRFKADEGTALALEVVLESDRPAWQAATPASEGPLPAPVHPWLDREKLRDLGFDVRVDPGSPEAERLYGRAVRRHVYLALEMVEGVTEPMRSRLAVVDASLDAGKLRRGYRGARPRVVVPGLVRILASRPAGKAPFLTGRVSLEVPFVHVPLELRSTLAPFLSKETPEEFYRRVRSGSAGPPAPEPRYAAVLAFGRANAAWLQRVTRLAP